MLWWQTRREPLLVVFIIHSLLCAAFSATLIALFTADSVASGQVALDLRGVFATAAQLTSVWLLALISGIRGRWFIWVLTACVIVAVLSASTLHVTGVVTGIHRVTTPWGETLSMLERTPTGWIAVLVYVLVFVVNIFGVICATRLWRLDRTGSALLFIAQGLTLIVTAWGLRVDIGHAQQVYIGALPYATWVILMALQIARENRRRAYQLSATERRFRAIFDQTFQFIGMLDVDGHVLEANRTALDFAGVDSGQIIGKPFWSTPWWTHAPDLQEQMRQAIAQAATGKTVRFEATHPSATGGLRFVDFSLKPVRDEQGRVVLLIPEARDITERKHAEEALRDSYQYSEQIIASAQYGLVVLDRDLRHRVWNPKMEAITGVPAAEVIGREPLELFPFLKDTGVYADMLRARGGATISSDDFAYHVPSTGRRGWAWQMAGPLKNARGEVVGVIACVVDITDRKRAEDARRALQAQVMQSQKLEAVGQLAGGVAHDFNNLLTVINGYADLLHATTTDHTIRPGLEQVRRAGERAASLTRQLLAFSRQSAMDIRVIDLNDSVNHAAHLLRRVVGEDVELVIEPAASTGLVRADPSQIERILINLVVNARDAMPDGGRVTIAVATTVIARDTPGRGIAEPGRYVRLSVSDTGHGIAPDARAHLFEPFFTTKPPGKGTGLGLAVVDGIVRQTHGFIDVHTESGRGTTFGIHFPETDSGSDEHRSELSATTSRGGTETVLLVDDNAGVRELARTLLTRQGYTVLVASDGTEALRQAREQLRPVDLVLTDLVMPGMSGRELVTALRMDNAEVRVLYMTGHATDERMRHEPDDQFLTKPFSLSELSDKVREVLDVVKE
jgi:PAS domain S-box-containing protein